MGLTKEVKPCVSSTCVCVIYEAGTVPQKHHSGDLANAKSSLWMWRLVYLMLNYTHTHRHTKSFTV